jgi:hypothetical protein
MTFFVAACIAAGAIVGWFAGAIGGLILGAAMGVPVAFLIGQLFLLADGGILPRKVRSQTARDFLGTQQDRIAFVVQGSGDVVKQQEVERILERLILESVRISTSPAQALEFERMLVAGESLRSRMRPRDGALLRLLLEFLPTHALWRAEMPGARVAWANQTGVRGPGLACRQLIRPNAKRHPAIER